MTTKISTKKGKHKVAIHETVELNENEYDAYKESIKKLLVLPKKQSAISYDTTLTEKFTLDEEIARREHIKNRELEQNIELKKETLNRLFFYLQIETAIIFAFAFFQAVRLFGFHMEEWSFRAVIFATISQITYMLHTAVKHLFPTKEKK